MQAQQLAAKMHVTPQCISNWENDKRRIPCEFLPALSMHLGYPELVNYRLRECPIWMAQAQKKTA
jgi:transcriptional regulator with XRE-family HTH domain